jgi:hypothetical protein
MEQWTEAQWDRAEHFGLLDMLNREEWPQAARAEAESAADGSCRSRRDIPDDSGLDEVAATGLARVRQQFRNRFEPEADEAGEPAAASDGFDVWEDEGESCWVTNYPPPDGFDGREWGDPAEFDYERELSQPEHAVMESALARLSAERGAERAADLARGAAARDAFFGIAAGAYEDSAAAAAPDASCSSAAAAGYGPGSDVPQGQTE